MQTDLSVSVPDWSKNDFIASTEPFEWLYQYKENKFLMAQLREQIKDKAGNVGVKNFVTLWNNFLQMKRQEAGEELDSMTEFSEQPMELYCGSYVCNDYGVTALDSYGREVTVCNHPIMPIRRLINIDTGEEKIEIAYKRGNFWKTLIVDKMMISSASKIVELSRFGVSVDSECAKELVKYFTVVIDLNYKYLPEATSVRRLGYIKDYGFSPYVEGLVFDGAIEFAKMYDAVRSHGNPQKWIQTAKECRAMSVTAKIMLASSFASVLLEPVNSLPFFVHLWGSESGTGKTVALMLAASVWGNPRVGEYVKTFDATDVGNEKTAAFLNHLPFCLDELQLIRNTRGQVTFNAYKLAQGVGRTRGNKLGGIDITPTWRNCILTTGETPITTNNSGAGAYNRIIEIECEPSSPVIVEGNRISASLSSNYGYAGRRFVQRLYGRQETDEGIDFEKLKERYSEIFTDLSKRDITEKQSMAAASIVLADEMITEMFFPDEQPLTADDLAEFMASKQTVSVGTRAYSYLCDWVSTNAFRLCGDSESTEVYGQINGDFVYIIRNRFDKLLDEEGFNPKSILSYLKANDLIDVRSKGFTRTKRINGIPTECVILKLKHENMPENPFEEMDLL